MYMYVQFIPTNPNLDLAKLNQTMKRHENAYNLYQEFNDIQQVFELSSDGEALESEYTVR